MSSDSGPGSNPFGRSSGPREPGASRNGAPLFADDSIVSGTGLKTLDGEKLLASVRRDPLTANVQREDLGLHLTNRRVVQFGRDRILGIFPSGRIVRSALIEDVDSVGVRTKRLPSWLIVIGLLLILVGVGFLIGNGDSSNGSDYTTQGTICLIVGIVLAAMWLLVQREVLVFSVSGIDHLDVSLLRRSNRGIPDDASVLIAGYYDLKSKTSPAPLQGEPLQV